MTNAHTPGPWHIDRTGEHHGQRPYGIRAGKRGLTRRNIVNWGGLAAPASPETEANARLIAAAPDLLEALRLARDHFVNSKSACAEICDAAIRKATTPNAGERG